MDWPGASSRALRWDVLIPLAGLWLLPCYGLAIHWAVNPQYHFGWFVPLLAIFCVWNRWETRPAPGAPIAGSIAVAAALGVAVLPMWLFAQPSPDWPVVNWLLTAQVAALTLCVVAAAGGQPWLRHLAVPAALIFTAVPWPDALASPVTQSMMRAVATTAVSLLDLLGVGALQRGNLIEVARGTVGVDEACSGIRSLQGSLMASIVLGELSRFSAWRRVILVAASLAVAFITNVFRAAFLAWTAAHSGLGAIDRWHDPAGFTILAICVTLILILALALGRNASAPASPASVPRAFALPKWLGPTLAVWLAATLLVTELWYRDGAPPPALPYRVELPPGSSTVQIPPAALAAFHSDYSTAATWTGPGAIRCLLYYFEWEFGPAFSRVSAGMHHPDVCLPASGYELSENRGRVVASANGPELPFDAYTFRTPAGPLFVYHGVWQTRSKRALQRGPLSWRKDVAAVQSVLWRERDLAQQSAEVIISNCRNAAAADAAFLDMLPRLLVPRASPSLAGVLPH